MKKGILKKILISLGIAVLVLIVAVVVVFNVYGDSLIRKGVEVGGQKALKVDVRLENISTSLLQGKVDLLNLEIDNPEGYDHEVFMKLGKAHMDLDTSTLFKDTILIDKFHMSGVEIVMEQKGSTSNIKDLMKNLPQPDAKEEPEPKPEPEEKKIKKQLIVKEVIISDFDVKANIIPGTGKMTTVTIPMKEIRLENVGTEEKVDATVLTSKIMAAISAGILESGADLLPIDMVKGLGSEITKQGVEVIKFGGDVIKGVGDTGGEVLKGAGDAGSGVIEGVGGALEGLLGGGKNKQEEEQK